MRGAGERGFKYATVGDDSILTTGRAPPGCEGAAGHGGEVVTICTEVLSDVAEATEAAFEEWVTKATGIREDSGGEREIALADEELLTLVATAGGNGNGAVGEALVEAEELTQRQREVVRGVRDGDTQREIAKRCGCSERTIRNDLQNVRVRARNGQLSAADARRAYNATQRRPASRKPRRHCKGLSACQGDSQHKGLRCRRTGVCPYAARP